MLIRYDLISSDIEDCSPNLFSIQNIAQLISKQGEGSMRLSNFSGHHRLLASQQHQSQSPVWKVNGTTGRRKAKESGWRCGATPSGVGVVTDQAVPEGHKGLHEFLYGEEGAEVHAEQQAQIRANEVNTKICHPIRPCSPFSI